MEKTQTPCVISLSLSSFIIFVFVFIIIAVSSAAPSPSIPRGVHPLDIKYYEQEMIKCKDGSNSFGKDRLNDEFCDCLDGTDEPGTSACPRGKFYCTNLGSQPRFLFSSRVNDQICDCCDGSDEYDGATHCPNTCIMGGSIVYKPRYHHSKRKFQANERKENGRLEDMIRNLQDLKVLALIQFIVIIFWGLLLLRCRKKSSRQRYRS